MTALEELFKQDEGSPPLTAAEAQAAVQVHVDAIVELLGEMHYYKPKSKYDNSDPKNKIVDELCQEILKELSRDYGYACRLCGS